MKNGTTRVSIFSSLHRPATLILMEELERAGVRGYVGKVNMDRNGGERLQEITGGVHSGDPPLAGGVSGLPGPQTHPDAPLHPLLHGRSDGLPGEAARERDLPVQSHLSENRAEMELVGRLHPDCRQYWETYAKFGLWKEGTLMGPLRPLRPAGAGRHALGGGSPAVHCAASNNALCSGIAPVRVMLNEGVKVALGSDVAAATG